FPLPSLAVIGTGKRVGKTAVTGHVARLLAKDRDVIVVAMGRGGPAEPQVAALQPTLSALLDLSRAGHHAASDHLETAALTGVVTIGCRRAGGGLAGAVTTSNVLQGAALAAERDPDVVVFDGSGAAIPPIDVDARILVSGRGHDPLAYLNAYRVLVSDLVVLFGEGDAGAIRALKKIPVVEADLRLRPISSLQGRRVAVFTTGAAPTDHLDAEVVSVSHNLANRTALREDIERIDADVYLVEIKAAAIDLVAVAARALVAVGVPLGRGYELAKRIDQDLAERGEQSVELERVEELAIEVLGEEEGSQAFRRLRRFRELQELDLPVIVLVGGATGTGK